MSLIKTLKELFHSFSLLRVAEKAEDRKSGALNRVHHAELALRNQRRNAVVTLKSEQVTVTNAISTADKEEAVREKERATEVNNLQKHSDAEIQALIAALELAQRNATKAMENLKKVHAGEREAAAKAKEAAFDALADLRAAQVAIETALNS